MNVIIHLIELVSLVLLSDFIKSNDVHFKNTRKQQFDE